jgi:hypothetical protein
MTGEMIPDFQMEVKGLFIDSYKYLTQDVLGNSP